MTTSRPEFEIQVGDGQGLLLLRPRSFFGWLRIEQLELRIPEVNFPLDITRGMAQFRQQRCPVERAVLASGARELAAAIEQRATRLLGAGFERVRLRLGARGMALGARARIGEHSAELVVELRADLDGPTLRLRVTEAHVLGFLRRPALVLAHDLVCVLVGAAPAAGGDLDTDAPVARALGEVSVKPLELCLSRVLPPAGWRMPSTDGLHPVELELGAGGARVRYALGPPRHADEVERPGRAADEALWRNDLGGAVAACRAELAALLAREARGAAATAEERRPDDARAVTARLLAILAARDGSLADARDAAEEALARWPDLAAAELALAQVALARGRDGEAADHFARAAERAAPSSEELAVRAWQAAAQLSADDGERAAGFHERVLALRPDEAESNEALAALYTAGARWRELARLERVRIAAEQDPLARSAAHLRLAQLFAGKLDDAAGARAELDEAVRLDPRSWRAWELLARVRAIGGDRAGAAAALEHATPLLAEAGERFAEARAHVQLAVWQQESGEPALARRSYERALALEPEEPMVLEQVALGAARQGDVEAAIATYQRLIAVCPADPWRRQRAERELLKLLVDAGEIERARALLEESGAAEPESLLGLAALERAAGRPDAALAALERAAAVLNLEINDPANEATNENAKQDANQEIKAATGGEAESEGARVSAKGPEKRTDKGGVGDAVRALARLRAASVEFERARLLSELGRAELQRAALERAHRFAPDSPVGEQAARECGELAHARGDAADEARWLDALLGASPRPHDWPELALRRAQLWLLAGDPAAACQLLDELRAADEETMTARLLHADVLGALDDASGRARVLEELAAEPSTVAQQAAWLVEAVHSRLKAGELAEALEAARKAQRLLPDDPMVRAALGEIAWQERAWDEVASIYHELVPRAQGPERVEWARRLGAALERHGRLDEAEAAYRIAVEPGAGAGAALNGSHRALAELRERLGDYRGAAEAFHAAAVDERTGEAPAARAELDRRAAELLWRRAGDRAQAIGWLEEGLGFDAGHLPSLDTLESIHAELGDQAEVARAVARKLDVSRDTHRRALDHDPQLRPSLRFLAADALRAGDRAAAERYYTRLAAVEAVGEDAAAERRDALQVLALLARDDGRPADAENHLWAAVALSEPARQHELLGRIEELYELSERWADLTVLLTHHASTVGDEQLRRDIELRGIRILLERVGDARAALEACRAARARAGVDVPLADGWVRAARDAGDAQELDAALLARAALEPDQLARAARLIEAAERRRVRHEEAGADALEDEVAALPLAPAELAALAERAASPRLLFRALEARVAELGAADSPLDGAGARLLMALQTAAEMSSAWAVLADGLELAAGVAPDRRTAASWLRGAAELRVVRLGDRARAAAALERALELTPDDAALVDELEPITAELRAGERFAQALERHLAAIDRGGTRRGPVLERLGQLWTRLGDGARGERYLAEARALEPEPEEQRAQAVKLGALVRAVAAPLSPKELASALAQARARLERLPADDLPGIGAVRLELGILYRRAGDPAAARQQLELVLGEQPSNARALEALIDTDLDQGLWADAAEALERRAQLADKPVERAALLFKMGELYLTRLGDQERASDAYLRAIDLDPRHPPTLRRLIDYYFGLGDRASVLELGAAVAGEAVSGTGAPTAARVAVSAALEGDAASMARWARALGEAGTEAIAAALADVARRDLPPDALLTAARLLCAPGGPSRAALKRALEATSDPRAAALAARLQ